MEDLDKVILILGLAAISAWMVVKTDGEYGQGWAALAVLVLLLG